MLEQNKSISSFYYFDDFKKKREKRESRLKKRKQFVIGSRVRERDKNNAEYYVGDYSSHGNHDLNETNKEFLNLEKYCGDPNALIIMYTNGLNMSNFRMVRIYNGVQWCILDIKSQDFGF